MSLVEKWRPRCIADLVGQEWAQAQLSLYVREPSPKAFLFEGATGTGKTSAAIAVASELGVNVEQAEFGGLYEIASGDQTGDSVRAAVRRLGMRPMFGGDWQVLVVNEADCMSANAAFVWLDVLENLPPRCTVIFTTNDSHKLPRRFRDRCEVVPFIGSMLLLRPHLEAMARRVWLAETGRDECPDLDTFGVLHDERGDVSFRRLLQVMEPHVRMAVAGVNVPVPVKPVAAKPSAVSVPSVATGGKSLVAIVQELLASGAKTSRELEQATGKASVASTITNLMRAGKVKRVAPGTFALTMEESRSAS